MTFSVHGLAVARGIAIGRAVLVERALAGGSQGLMKVALMAPQNQNQRTLDDQARNHHQQ